MHVWFSPPEFLQEVLARPDKTQYVLGALLHPLGSEQKAALEQAAEHGNLKGWAAAFGDVQSGIDTMNADILQPPLVCDLLKSKNVPRARWADELDFCTFLPCPLYHLLCAVSHVLVRLSMLCS